MPAEVDPKTKYFATLQLCGSPVLEPSIFLNFDLEDFLDNYGEMHFESDFVYPAIHGESVRGDDGNLGSDLSERPILLGVETDDWIQGWETGDLMPTEVSKLGGRPNVLPNSWYIPINEAIAELEKEGISQVVQFAFSLLWDADVVGEWPFTDGSFHLLGKSPYDSGSWHCFWQK